MTDTKDLYLKNDDFKRYVDAFAKDRDISAEEVLQFEIVRIKAENILANDMERR